jgi:acyl-CoA hydrolase
VRGSPTRTPVALRDGACLQIGIGAMPNAVCSLLRESGVRDLGIHTEMLTDGIIDLYKAGMLDLDSLISGRRPLEQAAEALEDLAAGRTLRTLLTMEDGGL